MPSPAELRALADPRAAAYGFDEEATLAIYRQMGQEGSRGFVSPFVSLPVAAADAEFSAEAYEAIAILGYEEDRQGNMKLDSRGRPTADALSMTSEAMEYFDYDDAGFEYRNRARQFGAFPMTGKRAQGPAPLTLVPTSTTAPERPRTVAAGYDKNRQVLTVVFRDGTYYNYYKVEASVWQRFKQVKSKGKFIKDVLDFYNRGVADVDQVPQYAREALYRVTRTSQSLHSKVVQGGRPTQQINRASRRASGGYR